MSGKKRPDIERLIASGKVVDETLQRAVLTALRRHKLAGESIYELRGGRVVEIPAEAIRIASGAKSSRKKKRSR